jgi:hypothetical protein
MSDLSDDFRAWREHKREIRATWEECPTCAVRYGGNGTKNPPGVPCRNCGWVNPKYACECLTCHRHFTSPAGLADHTKAKHQ